MSLPQEERSVTLACILLTVCMPTSIYGVLLLVRHAPILKLAQLIPLLLATVIAVGAALYTAGIVLDRLVLFLVWLATRPERRAIEASTLV
jgi:hypothetical protein